MLAGLTHFVVKAAIGGKNVHALSAVQYCIGAVSVCQVWFCHDWDLHISQKMRSFSKIRIQTWHTDTSPMQYCKTLYSCTISPHTYRGSHALCIVHIKVEENICTRKLQPLKYRQTTSGSNRDHFLQVCRFKLVLCFLDVENYILCEHGIV